MSFSTFFHSGASSRRPFAVVCWGLLLLGLGATLARAQTNPGEPGPPPVDPIEEVLRLRADEGVTGTAEVSTWADQSGNGNDATAGPLTGPERQANVLNGQPALRFVRSNDEGIGPDDTDQINTADGYAQRTISLVVETGGDVSSRQVLYEEGGTVNGFNVYIENGSLVASAWAESNNWGDHFSVSEPVSANTGYVVTFVFDSSASEQLALFVNGTAAGTVSDPGIVEMAAHSGDIGIGNMENDTQFDDPIREASDSGGEGFDGVVAELMLSNEAINSAQRQILESAFSERYGIGIANDRYAFGGYIDGIAGIGEASDGARQTRDESGVLAFTNGAPGGAGQFGLVGHNGNAESFVGDTDPSNIGTRLDRVWRYDETTGNPDFDLVFDVSGLPSLADGQSYKLLVEDEASGGDGTFTSGATTVVDGTLSGGTFTVSNLSALTDGDFVTLARTATDGASALTYGTNPVEELQGNLPVTTAATVTGGATPYSFSISAGTDPGDAQSPTFGTAGSDDVQIDASTGEVTVNSDAPVGTYTATVTVTDDNGESTTFNDVLTITVQQQVSISYANASQVVVANGDGTFEAIQAVTTSNPTVPDGTVEYSIASGDDPLASGLSFNQSTGRVAGTPNRSGLIRTVVQVEGSGAAVGTDAAELNVAVVGGTGPGGVGDANSTIANLDADTISGTTGDAVSDWRDASAYGNDVTVLGGSDPTYEGTVAGLNGQPALDFSGATGVLAMDDSPQFNDAAGGDGQPFVQRSLAVAFRTGGSVSGSTPEGIYAEGGGTRGISVYVRNDDLYVGMWNEGGDDGTTPWGPHFFSAETNAGDNGTGTVTVDPNTAYVVTLTYNYVASEIEAYVNGTLIGREAAEVGRFFDHNPVAIGGYGVTGSGTPTDLDYDGGNEGTYDAFTGQIGQVMAYEVALAAPQRQLLESALGAKYGVGVANARFDFAGTEEVSTGGDVVGVGQAEGTAHDPIVASGRLRLSGATVGADGEFEVVGHNEQASVYTRDDTGVQATDADANDGDDDSVKTRLNRVWRVDLNGGSLTSDIVFDTNGLSLGTDQEFVLVVDDDADIDNSSGSGVEVFRSSMGSGGTLTWTPSQTSQNSTTLSTALGDADYVTLARTLGQSTAPSNLTYSPAPLAVNDAATTAETSAPSFDGGQPQPTFSILDTRDGDGNSIATPSAISLDSNTGQLTVDPTTPAQGVYEVDVEAQNGTGSETTTVTVRIFRDLTGVTYADAVQTVTDGDAIGNATATTTPAVGDINDADLSYSFRRVSVNGSTQGDLSGTGLSLDASTGTISGTPTQLGTVSMVLEVDGDGGADGTATAPVKITTVGLSGLAGIGGNTTTLVELVSNTLSGPLADGQGVSVWSDGSPNGFDATQSTGSSQPTFAENALNGQPALQFDGADDVLALPNDAKLNTGGEPYLQRAITVVFRTAGDVSSRQVLYEQGGGTRGLNLYINGGTLYAAGWNEEDDNFSGGDPTTPWEGGTDDQFVSASTGISTNTAYVATLVFDYAKGRMELLLDGATRASETGLDTGVGRLYNHGGAIGIGGLNEGTKFETGDDNADSGRPFGGAIAAVAHTDASLSGVQRTILHNALAAQYGISLDTGNGATDVYAGHTGANGDYDLGVFGIGRAAGTNRHTSAGRDGLAFEKSGSLSNGEYLVAGHRTAENSVNTADGGLPGTVEARLERAWYVDVTGGSTLTTAVTVDLSEAGLGEAAGADGGYVLLERAANSSNPWTQVASNPTVANGDEITFSGVGVTDGTEITLGTSDQAGSPLGGAMIVLQGTEGNEGSVDDVDASGGDAGYVLLGPPKSGANLSDLASPTDPQLIEFGLPGPMIFTYDSASSSWAEVPSDQAMPSGEGFALFVFDDKGSPDADPVDPTLPITIGSGSVPSGPVTRTPSNEYQWVFLANPYDTPFDLSTITAGGELNNYSNTVQIWEDDAANSDGDGSAGTWVTLDRTDSSPTVGVGQAFFFECTVASSNSCPTTVELPASGKVNGDRSVVGYKSRKVDSTRTLALDLAMTVRANGRTVARDEAARVVFDEQATAGWERFDATKLAPFLGRYATLAPLSPAGDTLRRAAQAGLPWPTTDTVEVPLDTRAVNVSGTATLRLAGAKHLDGNWGVEVVDTKGTADPSDDVVHPLQPDGNGYEFELTASKAATAKAAATSDSATPAPDSSARRAPAPGALTLSDRLRERGVLPTTGPAKSGTAPRTRLTLRITPPASALPVEMAGFEAQSDGENAIVKWQTASETNNAGFHVEHQRLPADDTTATPDPDQWTRMGFVEGRGTTSTPQRYRYETGEIEYGRHVFRLRQVDTDGTETTTDPIELERRLTKPYAIEAPYPNPTRRRATLPVTVRDAQEVTVRVYDLLGRRVQTVRAGRLDGQETTDITLSTRQLASGHYFVRIRGTDFAVTERLVVVK